MSVRKLSIALAAATIAVTPLAAQAAPVERAAAPTAEESEIGGSVLWIILGIAAVIGVILLLDDKDDPVSS